jgi:anthranilate phosphoribosyltransferase
MALNFYLQKVYDNQPLTEAEAAAACEMLMQQDIASPIAGAFLMALAMRGEMVEELVGMALNLRKHTTPLQHTAPGVADIASCGTRDVSAGVQLGAALLMATAGVNMAKLLTPAAVTITTRLADLRAVATAIGLVPASSPESSATLLSKSALTLIDPADYMGNLRNIRAHQESLPIPTAFDRLLPLAHPATPQALLLGIGPINTAVPLAQALRRLRMPRALVLATQTGACPFTHNGKMDLVELSGGRISKDEIQPADFGIDLTASDAISTADAEKQGAWLRALIDGRDSPLKNPVIWTGALGLYAAGVSETLPAAFILARDTVANGRMAGVLALASRAA